ncbi:hypothetical protein PUN28_017257 [Cardiocondyla obscurior]|uniref:Uncharacterized protein n=1 Tax=Cardiocondyla obscurior TaxID=286306 RepID=A0AAW2EL04_9HYME
MHTDFMAHDNNLQKIKHQTKNSYSTHGMLKVYVPFSYLNKTRNIVNKSNNLLENCFIIKPTAIADFSSRLHFAQVN